MKRDLFGDPMDYLRNFAGRGDSASVRASDVAGTLLGLATPSEPWMLPRAARPRFLPPRAVPDLAPDVGPC
jgi:hypothetical protein